MFLIRVYLLRVNKQYFVFFQFLVHLSILQNWITYLDDNRSSGSTKILARLACFSARHSNPDWVMDSGGDSARGVVDFLEREAKLDRRNR